MTLKRAEISSLMGNLCLESAFLAPPICTAAITITTASPNPSPVDSTSSNRYLGGTEYTMYGGLLGVCACRLPVGVERSQLAARVLTFLTFSFCIFSGLRVQSLNSKPPGL